MSDRKLVPQWRVIVAAWLGFGALTGGQLLLGRWLVYDYAPPWRTILTITFGPQLFWALMTPVLIHRAAKYPFTDGKRARAAIMNLPLMLFCVFGHTMMLSVGAWIGLDQPITLRRVFLELMPVRAPAAVAIYVAVWAIGAAIAYAASVRDHEVRQAQLESQMAEARLQALRAQLHPHFLFNTLNTVAMAVRQTGNTVALNAVLDLSELLRTMLRNDGTHEVALAAELDFTTRYLAIEQLRFRDQLQVEVSAPQHLFDAAVPAVILQPIVENSLRHGLGKKPGICKVSVRVHADDGTLRITVEDNGPGFGGTPLRAGVGLQNTRARLKELYGKDGELRTASTPEGATVEVLLPLHRMPAEHLMEA